MALAIQNNFCMPLAYVLGLNATSRSYDGPLFRPTDVQADGDAWTIVGVPLESYRISEVMSALDWVSSQYPGEIMSETDHPFVTEYIEQIQGRQQQGLQESVLNRNEVYAAILFLCALFFIAYVMSQDQTPPYYSARTERKRALQSFAQLAMHDSRDIATFAVERARSSSIDIPVRRSFSVSELA